MCFSPFNDYLAEQMQDPVFRAEYEALELASIRDEHVPSLRVSACG
jgi:hypothetical protein